MLAFLLPFPLFPSWTIVKRWHLPGRRGILLHFTLYAFPLNSSTYSTNLLTQETTTSLPDWGKMNFIPLPPKPWAEILPDADEQGRDLVSQLVRYSGRARLPADEVCLAPLVEMRAGTC